MKELKERLVDELRIEGFRNSIDELITYLQNAKETGATHYDIYDHSSGFGYEHTFNIETFYEEEETDEEYEARLRRETEVKLKEEQRIRELKTKQFLKLKEDLGL
jgi:hypothetical protein